jgi:acyl-CoA thioester hydrolase
VNNVRFLRWFETARIAYMRERSGRRADQEGGQGFILAECHINYRAPAFLDDEIHVFVEEGKRGRSSLKLNFEMRRESDDELIADGGGTLVSYDYESGTTRPWPQESVG